LIEARKQNEINQVKEKPEGKEYEISNLELVENIFKILEIIESMNSDY
jgi:hypothetical protein